MAVLEVDTLRQRVAALVEALATPAAWSESPVPFDIFPQDRGKFGHLRFAVGVPRTQYESGLETVRANRGAAGGAVSTEVRIRWLYLMTTDNPVASYDLALEAEAVLTTALSGITKTDLHLWPTECSRSLTADGKYLLGEVRCATRHRVAIQ